MHERKMGVIVLVLLGVLNLFLFGYYYQQRAASNYVSAERIAQVKSLYKESGIDFSVEPDRDNRPKTYLRLKEADLDGMVEQFLGAGYDKSYIYGSKIQYTSGTVTITTDWGQHQVTYADADEAIMQGQAAQETERQQWMEKQALSEEEEQRMLLPIARSFVKKWMGEDVYLLSSDKEREGFRFIFCQMQKKKILYFNRMEVYVLPEGIVSASMTYWQVDGETEKTYELTPIDEILYALLGKITEETAEGKKEEVMAIMEGYQLKEPDEPDEETVAVPSVMIVLGSGRKYQMNRVG